jgi:hypothetical protein
MGGIVKSIGSAIGSVASAVGGALSSAVSGFSTGNFLTGVAVMVVGGLLSPKPKIPNSSTQQSAYDTQATNRSVMSKQPITSREIVYGESKKSGSMIFMDTTNNNKTLHLVIQIASHEIQSFETIYFNDEALTLSSTGNDSNGIARYKVTAPSKYGGTSNVNTGQAYKVRIKQHLGGDDQVADQDLVSDVSKWTTDHRLRGIAYLYLTLDYDADAFPNGIPNVSAEIKGKKLYDFRDGSTAFSSNPALAIYDYLTDTKIGLGVSTSNIDTTSFTSIANICDQDITLSGGGTENRYEAHGIVYSDIAPMEIIEDLLSSCVGVLNYTNGKFSIRGGAYVSPTITLGEDDFIGGFNLLTKTSRKELFNTVKGIFTSNETNWQPTDYPPVTSTTFSDADGETITADVNLAFTKSSAMAQRIAKITLFKNRQQMILSARLRLTAFTLQVGDTVQINNSRFGFSNKIFEVADWTFIGESEEIGIEVVLKETSSSVYDWDAEETAFLLDNTTLPSSQDVTAPSVSIADELRLYAETPITVMKVTCSSSQGTTNEFEVEAQNTNDAGSDFITLGRSKHNVFELVNAEDGAIYNVRARSINAFNVHSEFTTTTHEVIGKTAPPDDVTNFSSNVVGDIVHLNWTPVSNLDLSHYIIRHTPLTSSTKFEEGLVVAKKIGKPANTITLPAQTGSYMIKAIDVLGIESINSAKTVIIKNAISRDFNVVATATESPNFTGTKHEVEVVTRDGVNYLEILEGELFDNGVGNFDDNSGNFDDGGETSFNLDGYYDFPTFDLGGIYNSRVTFTCKFNRLDIASLFDSFDGLFDSQTGNFDGAYTEHNDINVELQISTSTDNSTYTDYRTYILGDYRARYIKLRAVLTTTNQTASPAIYELSATVDMPDRTVAEDDISAGTGGKVVTFSPAFKELQGLGIEVDDLDQNNHYVITSKSATGFTINFYQGSGTGNPITADFSYVAKGYGYVESA